MPSATAQMFEHLAERGHIDVLDKVRGTLRFEIADSEPCEQYFVTITDGDIHVVPGAGTEPPSCLIRGSQAVLEKVARGEMNAIAAVLRGELVIDGDLQLLMSVQRVFPGPPGMKPPTAHIKPAGKH